MVGFDLQCLLSVCFANFALGVLFGWLRLQAGETRGEAEDDEDEGQEVDGEAGKACPEDWDASESDADLGNDGVAA